MIRYIIFGIVLYCIYKIVADFLVPLFRVTRRMKRQVREFQRQAQANGQFQQYQQDNVEQNPSRSAEKAGEYIDFEEIKEK